VKNTQNYLNKSCSKFDIKAKPCWTKSSPSRLCV